MEHCQYFNEHRITKAPPLLEDPIVLELAKKYKRTPAQILLRFLTQLENVAIIPKSSNPTRQAENFKVNYKVPAITN